MSFVLLIVAFLLSRRKEIGLLFKNKVFIYAFLYFIVIFLNYLLVLDNLFFKVYDELTPLWISIIRRLATGLFIYFTFREEKQAIRLFHFYCAGLVLSSLASYPEMLLLKHSIFDSTITEGNEGYQRAIGFFSNPNDFAITTIVAIIFTYHQFLKTRNRLYFIFTLLLIPPVFLSYSRNGLACLLLAIFLTFYLGRKIKLKTILYIGIVFLGLCAVVFYVPSIRERVLLTFSGNDTSAIGRYLVIYAAYQKWLTMPFWGIGVLSAPLLMEGMGNEGLLITIHNFYAHALFESGLIGFVIVILLLCSLYKFYSKVTKQEDLDLNSRSFARASVIALIVTYFYIFSGNHIMYEFLWYLIGVQLVIQRSLIKRKVSQVQKELIYE